MQTFVRQIFDYLIFLIHLLVLEIKLWLQVNILFIINFLIGLINSNWDEI